MIDKKDRFKNLKAGIARIKLFFDVYKMASLIFAVVGSNIMQAGIQEYARSEPELVTPVTENPIAKSFEKSVQPIIIYKADVDLIEKMIKREINEHEQGQGGWH